MNRNDISGSDSGATQANIGTLIAFVLLVFVGGNNAVAVRFSNLELPPFWGAGIRFAAAALIFWIVVLVRRIALPKGRALIGALLYGVLAVGAAYAFLYWALVRVEAGLAMLILAFAPLITLFLAWAHGLERLRWRGLIGALIAITGILLGVGNGLGTAVPITSFLALVAGAACLAEGSVVFKLFPKSDPVATNALATTTGASLLIGLSLFAGEKWQLPTAFNTWAAFAYLVLIGSVVLFYLYLYVLARWTASATAYSFLLFPVVTVLIAAWLVGEVVSASFIAGGVLVLAGVWVGAISGPSRPRSCEELPPTVNVCA
jgi:drug/metabolite transporter (DMT)-like permease